MNFRWITSAAAGTFITVVGTGFSQLHAASRLPFADGTYVTDTTLCRMSLNDIGEKYLDRMGMMTYNIRGNKLDNGYEIYCEIAGVHTAGTRIRLNLYCETEGVTYTRAETWTIVGKMSFRVGRRIYTSCGRLLD